MVNYRAGLCAYLPCAISSRSGCRVSTFSCLPCFSPPDEASSPFSRRAPPPSLPNRPARAYYMPFQPSILASGCRWIRSQMIGLFAKHGERMQPPPWPWPTAKKSRLVNVGCPCRVGSTQLFIETQVWLSICQTWPRGRVQAAPRANVQPTPRPGRDDEFYSERQYRTGQIAVIEVTNSSGQCGSATIPRRCYRRVEPRPCA